MGNVEKPLLRHVAMHGKPTARQAYGGTALRGWKKQTPPCSRVDKVCNMACVKPSAAVKQRAHVQLVFHCERIWRTFENGRANDGFG